MTCVPALEEEYARIGGSTGSAISSPPSASIHLMRECNVDALVFAVDVGDKSCRIVAGPSYILCG